MRTINYIGNKSRFLEPISQAISETAEPGGLVCDLFAGTGVVSRKLAERNPVTSVDIQTFSKVLVDALASPRSLGTVERESLLLHSREIYAELLNESAELIELDRKAQTDPELLADVISSGPPIVYPEENTSIAKAKRVSLNALKRSSNTIFRYYGGVYFSYAQALEIDAILEAMDELWGAEKDPVALASLLGSASDLTSTIGNHFAQPVQPRSKTGGLKSGWVSSVTRRREVSILSRWQHWMDRYSLLQAPRFSCNSIRADYKTFLKNDLGGVKVVYADPPYTRDHYSRFYHVLETIAVGDDPGVTKGLGPGGLSRGLYRENRHQSPFSVQTKVDQAFEDLFVLTSSADSNLVLSYSPMGVGTAARANNRMMPLEKLQEMGKRYFRSVEIINIDSSTHSQFNTRERAAPVEGIAEYLLIGKL